MERQRHNWRASCALAALVLTLAACAGNTRIAPVEGRQLETSAAPVQPAPAATPRVPAVPAATAETQVFALPDAEVPPLAPVPAPDGPSAVPHAPVALPSDPALRELVAQAERASALGDRGSARATLERALKIKPGDAQLWLRLGELNFDEGEFEQALVMAQRARELAHGDAALVAQCDALISRAGERLTR